MLINQYLVGRLAQDHYRKLLRQAEEERRARRGENGDGQEKLGGLASDRGAAERLGRQLGRMIYSCYGELLDQGLSQDEAVELTRALIDRLPWLDQMSRRDRAMLGCS